MRLPDPTLNRWLSKYSDLSQRKRRRVLDEFAEITGLRPEDLLEDTRRQIAVGPPQTALDALNVFYNHLLAEGIAQNSASVYVNYVRSYFKANNAQLGSLPRHMLTKGPAYERGTIPFTQAQVKCMIRVTDRVPHKAAIAFLAQTGQRISVLKAVRWPMIDRKGSVGLVHVSPRSLDPRGRNTNKIGVRYRFVIGSDTMSLLDQSPDLKAVGSSTSR